MQEMAPCDQVTVGLVYILSVLETCSSFSLIGNRKIHRLEVFRRHRHQLKNCLDTGIHFRLKTF